MQKLMSHRVLHVFLVQKIALTDEDVASLWMCGSCTFITRNAVNIRGFGVMAELTKMVQHKYYFWTWCITLASGSQMEKCYALVTRISRFHCRHWECFPCSLLASFSWLVRPKPVDHARSFRHFSNWSFMKRLLGPGKPVTRQVTLLTLLTKRSRFRIASLFDIWEKALLFLAL
jgi:hypothetical protein